MTNILQFFFDNMNVVELLLLVGVYLNFRKRLKELKCMIYKSLKECEEE